MDRELEARFQRLRFRLNREMPFLAHLLNKVPPQLAPVGTARTRDTGEWGEIFFDPSFAVQLTESQLGVVWAHEVLHLAFGFFHRRGNRDLRGFNVAHDYAINLALDDFMKLRPGVLEWTTGEWSPYLDRAFEGMSAEQIYDCLQVEEPPEEGKEKGFPDAQDCVPDPEGGAKAWESQAQQWRMALAEAAQMQGLQGAGDLPASLAILVDGILKPRMPWADRLLRGLEGRLRGGTLSYARPSRRSLSSDLILPGPGRRRARLALVLDTSGSVQMDELRAFLGGVRRIAEASAASLRVLEVDAAIQVDEDVEDLDEWLRQARHLRGGGGTDFGAVPGALRHHPELEPVDLALLFTDGEPTRWPEIKEWPCRVVVVTTRTLPPTDYEFVRLELDQIAG